MNAQYDIALIGHYTKDTIVSSSGTRYVNGGGFNYGAHAVARMGLKVAAITKLAREDHIVVDELEKIGVDTYVTYTPKSTCFTLEYPSSNPDERVIYVHSTAEPFTPTEVENISAKAIVISPSIRGEVPEEVIDTLRAKNTRISIDAQGFVRIRQGDKLVHADWPDMERILAKVNVVKTDAVEAESLTGEKDIHKAAKMLADMGPKEIVLTHKDGLLVYADGSFFEAAFYPKELIGRSGRGDTCVSSYMAARLRSSPEEATIWAAAVASLKMEAEGPFRRDISEVKELIDLRYS
ncbi:MAG TPA: PfkB family carbohydrate kinase [Bacillota bacterium]|jgi:sugar/nucleoside kinase (ribokinase family)|nr:PfkB family carbohydrate kinase [Bacillota bacterium]